MGYYLWKAVLGRTPKLPIDRVEYERLLTAWRALATIVTIEEEWDCVIQNYIELEMELLRSAVNSMVLSHESYHEFQQLRLGFARRLANLLQSCKAYVDHTQHYLGALPKAGLAAEFKSLTSAAYDDHHSYRFMEALRAYAQHRGFPLHSASFDSAWTGEMGDDDHGKGQLRHSVGASIDLAKLRADKKFKPSVLSEIGQDLDWLDVAIVTREYVEALAGVHEALRSLNKPLFEEWAGAIRAAISSYADANDGDVLGLSVAEFDDVRKTAISHQSIFEDLPLRIEKLIRRNRNLVNLRLRYVTSEVTPKRRQQRSVRRKPASG